MPYQQTMNNGESSHKNQFVNYNCRLVQTSAKDITIVSEGGSVFELSLQ